MTRPRFGVSATLKDRLEGAAASMPSTAGKRKGIEETEGIAWPKDLLRKIGYKVDFMRGVCLFLVYLLLPWPFSSLWSESHWVGTHFGPGRF